MPIIRLDQQRKRVKVAEFELDNEVVFQFLDGKPEESRDDLLTRAIYIGVLALMEDRLAAFLAKTQNELGTELEHLKLIFDLKKQLFYQSTQKGAVAEDEIATIIREYTTARAWKDRVELTGAAAGVLPRNKTGDIVCHLDGKDVHGEPVGKAIQPLPQVGEVVCRASVGGFHRQQVRNHDGH